MKYIKYFFQFILTITFFGLFKLLGPKLSSKFSGFIFEFIGPYFRSKKIIQNNIKKAIPDVSDNNLKKITEAMWNNYGRVFAEYIFIKEFRIGKLSNQINVDGKDILDEIINK